MRVKQPKSPLQPGETLGHRWAANHTQSSQRATGGHLYLTDQRLLFEPHGFDASLGGDAVSLPLRDLTDVSRTGRDLRHFFGGGLRPRLAVTTQRRTHLFVVNGMRAKIEQIQEGRRRAEV